MSTDRPNTVLTALNISAPVFPDPVQLRLHVNEILHIQGRSGSGKSSLLRALVLASPSYRADLIFQGKRIGADDIPVYRSRVQYVPQTPFVPDETVEGYLRMPFRFRSHRNRAFCAASARAHLNRFLLHHVPLEKSCRVLSGGEFLRLAVLRAILLEPIILLLDEPTSALDPETTQHLYEGLSKISSPPLTNLVIASHDDADGVRTTLGTRLTYHHLQLDKGRIVT